MCSLAGKIRPERICPAKERRLEILADMTGRGTMQRQAGARVPGMRQGHGTVISQSRKGTGATWTRTRMVFAIWDAGSPPGRRRTPWTVRAVAGPLRPSTVPSRIVRSTRTCPVGTGRNATPRGIPFEQVHAADIAMGWEPSGCLGEGRPSRDVPSAGEPGARRMASVRSPR